MLGPVDYVVLGFKGNNFDGSILEELSKDVKSGVIRVIDLLFIVKDASGNVAAGEFEDQSEDLKKSISVLSVETDMPLFTEGDIDKVAELMEKDTAAAVLVIEHLWAKGLKKAIIDAGGFLIADGRIHAENVEADMQEMAAESAQK